MFGSSYLSLGASGSSSSSPLKAILNATQTPHQPLLVIEDRIEAPGVGLLKDLIRRDVLDGRKVILISALWPCSALSESSGSVETLDFSSDVPGYAESETLDSVNRAERVRNSIGNRISVSSKTPVQVYIDSLPDLLRDPREALILVKSILRKIEKLRAPSRLTLLLPTSCTLLSSLTSTSFSPTISHLDLYHPEHIARLSRDFLLQPQFNPTDDPRFHSILRSSSSKQQGTLWALQDAFEADAGGSSLGTDSSGLIVLCTIRKAQGGALKGMTRSLEGYINRQAVAWWELPGLSALKKVSGPETSAEENQEAQKDSKQAAASGHDTTFSLNLTPQQMAERKEVPIPYAHEGESNAADQTALPGNRLGNIIFEPGSEDDMDSDDPDDDLDF